MDILKFENEHSYLSNFWISDIWFDSWLYPSVEHAFQAAKTLNLNDRAIVRDASTPAKAKKIGRRIEKRSDWDSIRIDVMRTLVKQKFKDPKLLKKLCEIDGTIEEGNYWGDVFWGVDESRKGQNNLGKILMEIRDEFKNA